MYELISSFSTGEWSEYVVERLDSKYTVTHRIRVTGTECPYVYISKSVALAIDSVESAANAIENAHIIHYEICS